MSRTDEDRFRDGVELVQKLFEGVDSARLPLHDSLMEYTVRHVFGDVWQDPSLSLPQRELVTCAVLVASSREDELRLHFVGARNVGVPRDALEGMITHVAHYAGWPAAIGASRVLNEVWPEAG